MPPFVQRAPNAGVTSASSADERNSDPTTLTLRDLETEFASTRGADPESESVKVRPHGLHRNLRWRAVGIAGLSRRLCCRRVGDIDGIGEIALPRKEEHSYQRKDEDDERPRILFTPVKHQSGHGHPVCAGRVSYPRRNPRSRGFAPESPLTPTLAGRAGHIVSRGRDRAPAGRRGTDGRS